MDDITRLMYAQKDSSLELRNDPLSPALKVSSTKTAAIITIEGRPFEVIGPDALRPVNSEIEKLKRANMRMNNILDAHRKEIQTLTQEVDRLKRYLDIY